MILEEPEQPIDRKLRSAARATTVLGIAATLAAGVRPSAGMEALLNAAPLLIWALLPFALSLLGLVGKAGIARSVGLLLTSGFGLLAYGSLLFGSPSSTSGLAFLFAPFWQLLGCGAILLVTTAGAERAGG